MDRFYIKSLVLVGLIAVSLVMFHFVYEWGFDTGWDLGYALRDYIDADCIMRCSMSSFGVVIICCIGIGFLAGYCQRDD